MRSGYFVNEWSARFIVRGSVNAFMAAFATMLLTMPVSSNAHLITTPSSFDYHATINQLDRTRLSLESSDTGYSGESGNVSRLLDQLMKGYDKRLRPNYKGKLVEVGITMFISSVSSISEANMDFTLDFYFRQHWQDERLKFASSDSNDDELCISNEMLDKIWWPDTFFANAKSAQFHTATTKNAFLRIKSTGWITQSLRLTVTSSCPMDLTFFPMDRQVCSLEIESYAYSVKHIAYKWKDGPKSSVKLDKDVQLPQMKVRGYRVKEKLEVLSTGNYSRLACEFYFVRSLGYYIIQIYVPSSLIVVLSWVSFWLHRDAAPARVALGITTVLTMTTLISSTNASLPKISYLKSIDVYLVTCFVMVFASIVEYAAVSYIANVRPSARVRPKNKLPLVTTVYGHAGCGTGGCDQPNSAPPKLSWPQGQPVQTEVRLTSMRRLFTECDLHYLSVLGGRGDSDAYRIFVAANSAAGTNLTSNGGGGGAIMNGGGASRNGGGGANRNGTAAHQFVPPTGSSAGTSDKQLHQQLIRRIDDSTNKQTPSSSSQPTAAADLAAVNSSSVVVRLPHPTLPSHHPTLPSHPTLPPASSSSSSPPSKHRRRPKYDHITVANAIDRYSRIGFPVAFAALSSVYWIVYIHITPSDVDRDFVFVD